MTCKKCDQDTRPCELFAYNGRCEDCYFNQATLNVSPFFQLGADTVRAVLDMNAKKAKQPKQQPEK